MSVKMIILFVVVAILTASFATVSSATTGNVYLNGKSMADDQGPFHGIGFTFMAAMWMCKYDRAGFQNELAYMAARGFNFMRILSEVPGACSQDYWYNRSINCNNYKCAHGVQAYAWSDWDQQFRDCIDIAYSYGIRCEVTIFGGAGESFVANQADPWNPANYTAREAHCQRVLNNLAGRENKIILIEVANEGNLTGWAWWGGQPGMTWLRNLGAYLGARTNIPIALTAAFGPPDISTLYDGSAADLITEHFSRDLNTIQGHWLPVIDPWYVADLPCAASRAISSDEPIGPGSSISDESHPIHLASAAAFGYIAGKLALYVYHTNAGVRHDQTFGSHGEPCNTAFMNLKNIIPVNTQNWTRNDGLGAAAPFTVFCGGVPNTYWWLPAYGGNDGCHSNTGSRNGNEFICYTMGIRPGGVLMQARENMTLEAINPLDGGILAGAWLPAGTQFVLPPGSEAWILKGTQGFIPQTPYAGVIPIPGTVQAENFDNGAEGVSFHDSSYGNYGGVYRSTHVDVFQSGATYGVGWIVPGEWLEYTVNVTIPGLYTIGAMWASPISTTLHLEMNDFNFTGPATLGPTGGWFNWAYAAAPNINLNAGQQVLKVYIESGGFNLDYLTFTKQ